MGDTGPCGLYTEIFYNRDDHVWGGPPGGPKEDGDRYIEVQNIVFIQFNRQAGGAMKPLPRPLIDTGMGLERITAVLRHANSNYDIDLFRALIQAIAKATGAADLNNESLRAIANRIRSCAFPAADSVMSSSENRGYVLRHIIRRAVRHSNMLDVKETSFYKLVGPLADIVSSTDEDLRRQQVQVEQVLKTEEEQFTRILRHDLALLDEGLAELPGDTLNDGTALRLYDTCGFPVDLTADICHERNIKIDEAGFEAAMEEQRHYARETSGFGAGYNAMICVDSASEFRGYNHLELNGKMIALSVDDKVIDAINAGQEAVVVLGQALLHVESGDQVSGKGELRSANFSFAVEDTQRYGQVIGRIDRFAAGLLEVNDVVQADIDETRRVRTRLNHSAIHLIYAALRQVLGTHVSQKGSLVNDKVLRFDFSHNKATKPEEIRAVEDLVNTQVRRNLSIGVDIVDPEVAKVKDAVALLDEKYGEHVHVLSMDGFSTELCGGTHASRTGDTGLLRIISESGTAADVRHIEAVTGEGAVAAVHTDSGRLSGIAYLLKDDSNSLADEVHSIPERTHQLEEELQQPKEQTAAQESVNLSNKAVDASDVKLLIGELNDVEPKMSRTMVNDLKN